MDGFVIVIFLLCSTTSAYDIPRVKDYTVVRKLGGVFFGDTWLLRNETDNTEYVLKKIKSELPGFNPSGAREAHFGDKLQNAMSTLGKDHIGRFVKHFDDGDGIQLISIFEGSDLKKLLYKDINIEGATPSDWWVWMRTTREGKIVMKSLIHQLLLGVKFCNDTAIVHRDIKPANIVVCFEKTNGSCSAVDPSHTLHAHLRLIDFGSAVDGYASSILYGTSGPTWWEQYQTFMPPEAFIDMAWTKYSLSTKYDSWTVGQTILEFILGTPWSFAVTNYEAMGMIKNIDDLSDWFIYRFASLAEQCIGLPDVIEQEKMKKLKTCTEDGYADYIRDRDPLHLGFPDVQLLRLVRLLLEADPDSRIGVGEALDHPYFTSTNIGIFHYCIPLVLCLVICICGLFVLKICSNQWSIKGENIKKKRN